MERRIRALGIFLASCFLSLFVMLNVIQVAKAHSLATSPGNPAVQQAAWHELRGAILAADGTVLARSVRREGPTHHGSPRYARVYPRATAALYAGIVGFDSPTYGRTGVEASYDRYLAAHEPTPHSLRDLLTDTPVADDVTLTVEPAVQEAVATALAPLPHEAPAAPVADTQASAVVVDTRTGAILAMDSTPSYDPNLLVSPDAGVERKAWRAALADPANPMLPRAYEGTDAPGSTFKVVTSAAVYDHDPSLADRSFTPVRCINTAPHTTISDTDLPLCNATGGGGVPEQCGGTLATALAVSCDTAFAQLGMALGADALAGEARAFGFGRRPPPDLPGAAVSHFPAARTLAGSQAAQAYSAFGQLNVTASALQMALVAAGIADGGVIMAPHVMAEVRDPQGNLVEAYHPRPWLRATSAATASRVASLMQGVVTEGTASDPPRFPADEDVAAKTGTAQVGSRAQYTSDWMIAFSTLHPAVAVAVVAPYQASNASGASVTGPVACAILQAALGSGEACPS